MGGFEPVDCCLGKVMPNWVKLLLLLPQKLNLLLLLLLQLCCWIFSSMANLGVNSLSLSPLLWRMMDCYCVDFACCLSKKTFKRYFERDDPPPPLTPPSFLNWRSLNPCCKMLGQMLGTDFADSSLSFVF